MSSFDGMEPNDYLGQDYADFVNKMLSLTLTDPNTYFKAKGNATQNIKREVVRNFYKNIYSILTTAELTNANGGKSNVYAPKTGNAPIMNFDYQVSYPKQKIVDIGLSFSATIDKMLDEIISIMFPHENNKVLLDKLSHIGSKTIS